MYNNTERTYYYVAKTLRMANFLAKKFDILKVVDDRENPNYKVFLFEDTLALREYLRQYK
jgi:hypothetical protein